MSSLPPKKKLFIIDDSVFVLNFTALQPSKYQELFKKLET